MNTTMKAWQLSSGTTAGLELVDRPTLQPRAGEVLFKLSAASLNYRDLLIRSGNYGVAAGPRPTIPASDGVGAIVAIGASVTRWKVGDRVAGAFRPKWLDGELTREGSEWALGAGAVDGILADYVALPETGVVAVPAHLTDEEAAALPCAAVTAWNAVFVAHDTKPGDTVLILGTGGVSLFALQFAKLAGARVILTSSDDAKLERGRALGADETLNYRTHADWPERVLSLTGGRGVDLAVDVVGGKGLNAVVQAARFGGTVALIGVLEGFEGPVSTGQILRKGVRIQGISVGSVAMFESMNRAIAQARLRPVIDRVFPFEEVPAAYKHLASGKHFGKVVIRR